MEAICSLLLIRPPARKSDPATDHCRWREPALWAPAACLRAFSIPSKPWTRALVPPASTASLPGGFFRLGVKETWPCGKGGPLCRAARAAAHGGSRGRVESRLTSGDRKTSPVESSVCSLAGLAARPRPTYLSPSPSLRVIRLPFQLFPCSVGVACVWQPCEQCWQRIPETRNPMDFYSIRMRV